MPGEARVTKRALVTGGAGFIGSHVVDRLLEEGYEVTAVDNLSEGHLENIAHLKNEKRFRFVKLDLKDRGATMKAVKGNDVVFHMAAQANIRKSIVDHRGDLENNLMVMINVLDGMVEHKVGELVFASSSAVYGEAPVTPTPEDYLSHQTSLYGASKLACVTGRAKVLTEDGPKEIREVRVGDLVYTHKNNLKRVKQTFRRLYDGELINIRFGSGDGRKHIHMPERAFPEIPTNCEVSATPEHPVLTETGWKSVGGLAVGEKVAVVANRCISCKKLIPYWTISCSQACTYAAFPDIKVKIGNKTRGHPNYNEHLFKDPTWRADWLRKTLGHKEINSQEFYIWLLIKEAGGDSFSYVGNGQRVIGGYCPDFVSEPFKAIIEYQGRSGSSDVKRDNQKRINAFRDAGYNVLVLNDETDFRRPIETVRKIAAFITESIAMAVRTDPEFIFWPVQRVRVSRRAHSRRPVWVYNLEVEDDNSYICQGIAMHNCEAWAEAFVQFAPIKVWSFRFANVVGERCRRGVIWDFVHKLQRNPKELEILGNGKQSKEYLHVKDCVEGMMTGWRKSKGPVEAFNLGQPRQTLVDEVADIVIAEMKLDGVKRKYTGGEHGWIGDNKLVELSLERMKKLEWMPKTTPEEAISVTTGWTLAEA